MIDAWRLAVGTLTALPTRPPGQVDPRVAGGAMLTSGNASRDLNRISFLHSLGTRLGIDALGLGNCDSF